MAASNVAKARRALAHLDYDPVRGGGDLYLEPKEMAGIREPAILTFANEDQVHAALARIEKQFFAKRA
jgi:hypothetical protein